MMMDLANPTRFGVRIGSHIEHDRIVPPRALPQLVENAICRVNHGGQLHPVLLFFGQASKSKDRLHVLFGPPVPLVVFHLLFQAEVPSCRIEVRSDDIERDPSLCEVIQRGKPPC
jgi:hypothetical protein